MESSLHPALLPHRDVQNSSPQAVPRTELLNFTKQKFALSYSILSASAKAE